MEVVLGYSNDRFKLELIEKNKRKRTSNINKISEILSELPSGPIVIKQSSNDIKIIYHNGIKLTLKDYKKYRNSQLYGDIFANIDKTTPIVKNINRFNKVKFAALALTSVVLVTTFLPKKANDISVPEVTITSTIPVEEPSEEIVLDNDKVSIDESNYEFLTRLEQTSNIINGIIPNNSNIPLGTKLNEYAINKLTKFINSEEGKYCFEVCNDFGIDPYTYISLMMNESSLNHEGTLPGGKYYNGSAVGISQLEKPSGQEIKAFNYTTNQEEVIYETMENAMDLKTNIKMGIMHYQSVLNRYNGNNYLAIQSYNYGYGLLELIVTIYADEIGCTYDEVVNNFSDVGWLKYVMEVYENPNQFGEKYENYSQFGNTIKSLKNWKYNTYGNGKYLFNLYSYYIGMYSKNIVNGEIVETNLLDNSVVRTAYTNQNDYKIS